MGVYEAQKEFISSSGKKVIIYVFSDWQFEVWMYLDGPVSMEAVMFMPEIFKIPWTYSVG